MEQLITTLLLLSMSACTAYSQGPELLTPEDCGKPDDVKIMTINIYDADYQASMVTGYGEDGVFYRLHKNPHGGKPFWCDLDYSIERQGRGGL